jgi:hypothetical protein
MSKKSEIGKKTIHVGTINMMQLILNRSGKLNPVQNPTAFSGCKVQESEKTYKRSKQKNKNKQKIKEYLGGAI